jgi:hypothetical protein
MKTVLKLVCLLGVFGTLSATSAQAMSWLGSYRNDYSGYIDQTESVQVGAGGSLYITGQCESVTGYGVVLVSNSNSTTIATSIAGGFGNGDEDYASNLPADTYSVRFISNIPYSWGGDGYVYFYVSFDW